MASKLDFDIDDLLDDIGIGDEKTPKSTSTAFGRVGASSAPKPAPVPAKKSDGFDDFYDDEPISEANIGEITKSLPDADKMEKNLFGGRASSLTAVDSSSTNKGASITDSKLVEKPMSAPGSRSTETTKQPSKSDRFDDFEVDSLLPDEAPPSKPSSANASLSSTAELPQKASSLPLPDTGTGSLGNLAKQPSGSKQGSGFDLNASGEFTNSNYMPSTGPTRSAIGAKSVSFADDRPPTRVGKKPSDDLGGDWLELAGGNKGSGLDDLLSSSSSRRPGTSVTPGSAASSTKAGEVSKPKSAPGGLGFGDLDNDVHRASQSKGPAAGSAYGLMKSEREDSDVFKPHSGSTGLSILKDDDDVAGGAPQPPISFSFGGQHSAAGTGAAGSSSGMPEIRGNATTTVPVRRPTAGSSILLDTDNDIFSSTGDFNPLRSRRPTSSGGGSVVDAIIGGSGESVSSTAMAPSAAAPAQQRQQTPPSTAQNLPGFPDMVGDALGADSGAVTELHRLVQLHTRESQLSSELAVVRRHMDVNKLYLQRILSQLLDTPIPMADQTVSHALNLQQQQAQPPQQQQIQQQPQQHQNPTVVVDESKMRELEVEVAQLRVQVSMLQSIKETLQIQHEQEIEVVRKSYQRQIDEMEHATRHKEERLKTTLTDLSEELEATRKRHADEMTEKSLSHKSENERIIRERDDHVRQMQNRQRQEMIEVRRAHEEQVELLRAERRADAASAGAAPELKALADHLAELESNVSQRHDSQVSYKLAVVSDREAQLRSQEAALTKEREQIRQALVQLEQARNELQQQRWAAEQREARLSALQTATEEERRRLSESADRDRAHLDKMRSDMVEEHSRLLGDIFRERQRLSADAERVEAEHRQLITAKSDLQHQQALSAQTIAQARQAEERMQADSAKMMADRERMLAELRSLEEERATYMKTKQEIEEQRRVVDAKMRETEAVAAKGKEAILAAEGIRAEVHGLKSEIAEKQAALNAAQAAFVEDRNRLNQEKGDLEQLWRSFVCSRCNRKVSTTEVQRVIFEASPKFLDIRERLQLLDQQLTEDLQETKAERDTDVVMVSSRQMPKKQQQQMQQQQPRSRKAKPVNEFDYAAEREWLRNLQRTRLQSTTPQ